ncbi:NUDIX hydrolase [Paramicrobacterium fandaimingii]|uniref:NUDIX hydrolase n=1 Tax=Paramicrobacterium fandaimingii TaxID=2708079 RepID=UPI001422C247|nr:NUDIX domain-containing protein [Microbacterium fandaimingii]
MTRREAARVILLDESRRVLLLHGSDPEKPRSPAWWFTPGGGLERGESHEHAAKREVREETGLDLDSVEGPVFEHTLSFSFAGTDYVQHELFFTATVAAFSITTDGWTDRERHALGKARWWSLTELRSSTETIYPQNLIALIE